MNKHKEGFNMSKIKHMRKNQGFSEIKFIDNATQTACLKDLYTYFSYLKEYPLTIFSVILIIFEF